MILKIQNMKYAALITAIAMMSACGGGGSDSGGGSDFAGTYIGSGAATVSGLGGSFTADGGFTLVIMADGTVQYFEGGQVLGTGTISSDQASWVIPGSVLNGDGITCSGNVNYSGTADGLIITGSLASTNLVCNGANLSIGGTWEVVRAAAKSRVSSLTKSIGNLIPNAK
ncbi:MAG: hypothetical protein ACI810_002786 [Gammaproteobacteria bacterium]|jgi:hypothetical protein